MPHGVIRPALSQRRTGDSSIIALCRSTSGASAIEENGSARFGSLRSNGGTGEDLGKERRGHLAGIADFMPGVRLDD